MSELTAWHEALWNARMPLSGAGLGIPRIRLYINWKLVQLRSLCVEALVLSEILENITYLFNFVLRILSHTHPVHLIMISKLSAELGE